MTINHKRILIAVGLVFLLVGVLGSLKIINDTGVLSLFGTKWTLDEEQNWAHFILAAVSLAAGFLALPLVQKILVWSYGFLGIIAGVWGLFLGRLFKADIGSPGDILFYLIIGSFCLSFLAYKTILAQREQLQALERQLEENSYQQ